MERKAYIITFDKGGLLDTFDYNKFHEQLTKADGVISWWHYLQTTYILIVGANSNATSITNTLLNIMPNKHFFVSKLDLKDHNGLLPKEAWEWTVQQSRNFNYR